MTASGQPRVMILHNVIAPYRLPLFSALGRAHEVHVLFATGRPGARRWDTSVRGDGFTSSVLPSMRAGRFILNPTLIWALTRYPADVYIVADNDENVLSIVILALFAKVRRTPLIVWNEHVIDRRGRPPVGRLGRMLIAAKDRYRRWLYPRAAAFLSMSGRYTDQFLAAHGVDPERVFTGIQVMPRQLLVPAPKATTHERRYLLFLGYLRPEKGADLLIAAFSRLGQLDLDLVIAGTGPEEDRLRALACTDPRVRFPGYVDGEQKADLIAAAEAMIVPSRYEPWGMVVNEALAYGTPVLASDAVAASALLSDGSGATFVADDVRSIVDAIERYVVDESGLRTLRDRAGALGFGDAPFDPIVGTAHFDAALVAVLRP